MAQVLCGSRVAVAGLSWLLVASYGQRPFPKQYFKHREGIHDTWNTSGQKAQGDIAGMVSSRTSSILPSCQRKQRMQGSGWRWHKYYAGGWKPIRNSAEVTKDSASRKCNVPFRDLHGTDCDHRMKAGFLYFLFMCEISFPFLFPPGIDRISGSSVFPYSKIT